MNKIFIECTGALGDTVMLRAICDAASSDRVKIVTRVPKHFQYLFEGMDAVETYHGKGVPPDVAQHVDLRGYLDSLPHTTRLNNRHGHLVEWMAKSFNEQVPDYSVKVTPDNVLLPFDDDPHRKQAHEIIDDLRSRHGDNKQIILIAATSKSANRTIPGHKLAEVARASGDILCDLVGPDDKPPRFGLHEAIATPDVRLLAATSVLADAVVCVDSGPLHVINGALRYARNTKPVTNARASKVVVALGSSRFETVAYPGNVLCTARHSCQIAPCGAHGYTPINRYEENFNQQFYGQSAKNSSACIYQEFSQTAEAPCMQLTHKQILDAIDVAKEM